MAESAAQLRRDAVARIGQIAGYDDRLDVDLTIARGSLQVLARQALRAAAGDEGLLDEVRDLARLVGRDVVPIVDATHEGVDVHDPATEDAPMSTDQMLAAITEVLGT